MLLVLSILANVISVGTSLMMLVLLLASGANSSEKQIAQIRLFLWSVFIVLVVSLVASIWTFVKGRYGISAGIGILPAVGCVALLVWMLVTEW